MVCRTSKILKFVTYIIDQRQKNNKRYCVVCNCHAHCYGKFSDVNKYELSQLTNNHEILTSNWVQRHLSS